MCRFFIYFGEKKYYLFDLLYSPKHSILKQSYMQKYTPLLEKNNHRDHEFNVDGFGILTCNSYNNDYFLYTNTLPPWNDHNLKSITKMIRTKFIFSHIRAIKPFSPVSSVHVFNCHPFIFQNYAWMHNGDVSQFLQFKYKIIKRIDNEFIPFIKGNSDSEHLFYLFLTFLKENKNKNLIDIFNILFIWINEEIEGPSSLNIALTDKQNIICTRFIAHSTDNPPSLYYKSTRESIMISSEPIFYCDDWILIEPNNILYFNKLQIEIKIQKINFIK